MTINVQIIKDRLAPQEQKEAAELDEVLTAIVDHKARREYTYCHSRNNYPVDVLQTVQKQWQNAGWDFTYDNHYIYLRVNG